METNSLQDKVKKERDVKNYVYTHFITKKCRSEDLRGGAVKTKKTLTPQLSQQPVMGLGQK